MVQVILTGVGVLLILASWQFMVLPSLTDECRDTLRALRTRTEVFFQDRTDKESSAIKRALLGLLDSEIRNVHKLSIVQVALVETFRKEDPDVAEAASANMEEKFSSSNEQTARFVGEIRQASAHAIVWYIARKHLFIWVVAVLAVPFVIVHASMKKLSDVLNEAIRQVLRHGGKILGTRPGRVQQKIEESFIRMDDVEHKEERHMYA